MKTKLVLPSLILFYSCQVAFAKNVFIGRVVGVSDGDTITVMHDGRAEKVKLNGIGSPERGQSFGYRAKQFVFKLGLGQGYAS